MAIVGHVPGSLFDERYYANNCGSPYAHDQHWLNFFGYIADRIVTDLNPKSVLDAGCAWGILVETLRDREVEAWGIDISSYAISQVVEKVKPYCWVGSISIDFNRSYDLIVCIEVLEHMEKIDAACAVKNLCEHADRILFSSSPHDYSEATHFNVQPMETWAREFARHGFYRDLDFDATFLTPWAMLFRKANIPSHQLVYDYERKVVLVMKENQDLRQKMNELEQSRNTTTVPSPSNADRVVPVVDTEQNNESLAEIREQRDTYFQQLNTLLESEEWQTFQEFKKIHDD
ncbi:MAG: class I SAM-dependent methyltransferase [Anaerolineaceae bacterium]